MYADKIFDMFFRTTANPNQTGLGLYVVKVAVEKLNGNIVLKESPAGLTTFEVKLPYPKPTSPEVLTLQVQKRLAGTTELRDL
jgi:signal transduction histidine kinase